MFKKIKDCNVKNKVVFVRADMNISIKNGKIIDDTRIKATIPTVEFLVANGAKVVLTSHLGKAAGTGFQEEFSLKIVLERLKEVDKPVILIINKIDKISKEQILLKISEYKDLYNFAEIIPLSALKHNNIETVVSVLKKYLPDNMRYFDDNTYTNSSEQFMISEIIREKVFND